MSPLPAPRSRHILPSGPAPVLVPVAGRVGPEWAAIGGKSIKPRKTRAQFLESCRHLRSLYPVTTRIAITCGNFSPHLTTRKDARVPIPPVCRFRRSADSGGLPIPPVCRSAGLPAADADVMRPDSRSSIWALCPRSVL